MFGGEDPKARERIAHGVRRWRDDLNEALKPHLAAPLEWDEDQERCWSRDLPDGAHRALLLLAAHAQKTDLRWPDGVPPRVDMDPAFQEISAEDFARCHYPQVVIPGLWVPGDFAFTMKHALPNGEQVVLGSLDGLGLQLRQLNVRTLQLGEGSRMGRVAPDEGFLDQAGHGLRVFTEAAEQALMLGVPLTLT